jgi:hypothetical protein
MSPECSPHVAEAHALVLPPSFDMAWRGRVRTALAHLTGAADRRAPHLASRLPSAISPRGTGQLDNAVGSSRGLPAAVEPGNTVV